jgi:energy-coupling factor transporter ATP-binding protein EcfA2
VEPVKIQKLRLENFKRFQGKDFDFRDPETGLAEDLIVLIGQNGSGKSSVLQAIASMLGAATGRLSSPAELDWPGFDLSLANATWSRPTTIEIDVEFTQDELQASRDAWLMWQYDDNWNGTDLDGNPLPAGTNPLVTLRYNPEKASVETTRYADIFNFRGRYHVNKLAKYTPETAHLLERVGGVFWYTEHRTTNSLTPIESNGQTITFDDMDRLRQSMAHWFYFHERVQRKEYQLRPGQPDFLADIERAYRAVFPDRCFKGPEPRTELDEILAEPWFYLSDGHGQYELSEMSGGERAIFPLLFDFAYWNIHNSAVLIDELELHLHPPLQQGLLKALRSLGENNQFIITTHSEAVTSIIPEESIRRL